MTFKDADFRMVQNQVVLGDRRREGPIFWDA
jgi:hypothetical protein